MEPEQKSQFAKMALIGGAVLLGAIAVIKLLGGDDDEREKQVEVIQKEFQDKIKQLGPLKRNEKGIIEFSQFKSIFQICA
jgi:hypothetical protein